MTTAIDKKATDKAGNGLLSNTYLSITILLMFDSLHLIFARWLAPMVAPLTASFWVLMTASVILLGFVWLRGEVKIQVLWNQLPFFLTIGFLVAGATWLSYTSLQYVDAGTAGLLSRLSTIFAILFGVIWLGDRMTPLMWIGAGIAVLGAVTIRFQPIESVQTGALIVVAGSFAYAAHAAVVKKYGDDIDFINFFLFRVLSTTFALAFFVLISNQTFLFSGTADFSLWYIWFALIVTGILDVILSRTFYYSSLRRIPISFHSIILMLAPVVTIMWSYLFFGEVPSWQGFVGGAIVIFGIALVSWSRYSGKR